MDNLNCKDCLHFQRAKWHPSIDRNEDDQLGGHCDLLLKMLQMTNGKLWAFKTIHIQESFGCVLFKEK